jgi:hypothetical protein
VEVLGILGAIGGADPAIVFETAASDTQQAADNGGQGFAEHILLRQAICCDWRLPVHAAVNAWEGWTTAPVCRLRCSCGRV